MHPPSQRFRTAGGADGRVVAKVILWGILVTEYGSFYEYYGQEGMTERFRESLLAVITDRTAAYDSYLAEHSDYAAASSGNELLLQDDRYMAGQRRANCNVSEMESPEADSRDGFDMEELIFAGTFRCRLTYRLDEGLHLQIPYTGLEISYNYSKYTLSSCNL